MAMRSISLPVSILREGNRFIAFTPALDLSTSGRTSDQAKERFDEAVQIFFDELERMDTVDEVLTNLGWQRVQNNWNPPVLVAQKQSRVRVPV